MSEHRGTTHSLSFWRSFDRRSPYVTATTATEDADAPIELQRRYGDNSGDEVLVSLTRSEWIDLIDWVRAELGVEP